MEKGNYNPYDEDVDIIQDNDDIKIVKVLTLKAAQYFGTDFYGNDNWNSHYRNGDLYFNISKKDKNIYSILMQSLQNLLQKNLATAID